MEILMVAAIFGAAGTIVGWAVYQFGFHMGYRRAQADGQRNRRTVEAEFRLLDERMHKARNPKP